MFVIVVNILTCVHFSSPTVACCPLRSLRLTTRVRQLFLSIYISPCVKAVHASSFVFKVYGGNFPHCLLVLAQQWSVDPSLPKILSDHRLKWSGGLPKHCEQTLNLLFFCYRCNVVIFTVPTNSTIYDTINNYYIIFRCCSAIGLYSHRA